MPQKYTSSKIDSNSLGGGDAIIDVLKKRDIANYINSYTGERSARAEYSYGEGIITWLIAQCSAAKRFENVYDSREYLGRHPRFNKGMSPDTLLYMFKELAVPNQYYPKETISEELQLKIAAGKAFDSHEVNSIGWFNELLIDMALKLGRLRKNELYILDYDVTEIQHKIAGGRKWYKGNGKKAYCPAFATINKIPVYIENRNGDSNPAFNLTITIDKVLDLLESKGIVVKLVRLDAAGFNKEFTEYANRRGIKYITRASSPSVKKERKYIRNWEETKIKRSSPHVGDTVYHFGTDEARMVVKKVTNNRDEDEKYWGLITNDFDSSSADIIRLYDQRGDSENLFRDLKGFGLKIMPMRNFSHNTVYLYIVALNYIIYRLITKLFSSKMKMVQDNMLLKTFTDKFMTVPTIWKGDTLVFLKRASAYVALAGFT